MPISTPPLSPRRDINIVSPSPLRISDDQDRDRGMFEKSASEGEDKENNIGGNVVAGNNGKDPNKTEEKDSLSANDVKTALLSMGMEDVGGNALVVEAEEEGEKGADAEGEIGGALRDAVGQKYVSPSDALMSPCTQQLNALKGRKIARGGESGVRRLFGDRIGKGDEKMNEEGDDGE